MIRIFTPSFADEAETNAQNLTVKEIVARLPADRFHVTMFCEGAPDPRIASRSGTTLWQWRKHGNTARSILRMLCRIPHIYFFPRTGPFDDVFFSLRRTLRWHTRVITYHVTGGLDQQMPAPKLGRNLREADMVVGNSLYVSELLWEKLGIHAKTICDGADHRFFFPRDGREKNLAVPLRVLFAGSFRPYKRAELVVREAQRWPDLDFYLAGRGEEEDRCRALAREHRCGNVTFLGHLSQSELGKQMRSADIFFFPSALEGHPQVLLQAAACGLPCIARSSYRPQYVIDGETGFLVKGDEELGQSLARLIQNPELRRSMSLAAVSHAVRFDLERVAREWIDIFEQAGQKL